MKSAITTHILDTSLGLPAANVTVTLLAQIDDQWHELDQMKTDQDGRISFWPKADALIKDLGVYKLTFNTKEYFGEDAFYPVADIVFRKADERHHHIPLLLTAYGYSTYRGS
jgi:5-hydroxyisourate hydrolase